MSAPRRWRFCGFTRPRKSPARLSKLARRSRISPSAISPARRPQKRNSHFTTSLPRKREPKFFLFVKPGCPHPYFTIQIQSIDEKAPLRVKVSFHRDAQLFLRFPQQENVGDFVNETSRSTLPTRLASSMATRRPFSGRLPSS